MRPAILWGFGNLGRALARTIEATTAFEIVAVIETAPGAAGRTLRDLLPGCRSTAPVYASLSDYPGTEPATVFHATTSSPKLVVEQVLAALERGHAVLSAAEWMFHSWLRFGDAANAFDAAARAHSTWALGCGINPGFCFETLPIVLSRTVHSVSKIDILRIANVSGIGAGDFVHVGLGMSQDSFFERVAKGEISGHMGFPESIAALAEALAIPVDRMSDHLVPTLAVRPLDLSHRRVEIGEIVGITQTAIGYVADRPVIDMKLEMFLDPEGYGRSPQEAVEIKGSRSFAVTIKPAAPPVDGAAAMMVDAARALPSAPHGLVSLLDLPLGGAKPEKRLRATETRYSRDGADLLIGS